MQTQITEWSSAFMTSLAAALALFFAAIPKIIAFLVIVAVGWFLSSMLEKAVAAVLRKASFNEFATHTGFADFMHKMGTQADASGVIALIAKWFVRLIALMVAFDALGLPAVSDVVRQVMLWIPNAIVALAVLLIGGLAAKALGKVVRGAAAEGDLGNPDFLGKVASGMVWAFTIVVAVNQIGIATTLVNTLFMAVVGAFALALGLAFGLGARDTAGEIVRKWYGKSQQNSEQLIRSADAAGDIAEQRADQLHDQITRH